MKLYLPAEWLEKLKAEIREQIEPAIFEDLDGIEITDVIVSADLKLAIPMKIPKVKPSA